MLTPNEKEGFREILQTFDEDDLIALKDTVTNRLVASHNKREAITAILTYTEDALQLLKRKKLKRDAIFQYLDRHRVLILPNADKNKLIRTVLAHWGSNINQEANRQLVVEDSDEDDDVRILPPYQPQHVRQHVPHQIRQHIPQHEPHVPHQIRQHIPQHEPQHEPQRVPQYIPQALPAAIAPQAGREGMLIDRNHQNSTGVEKTTSNVAQQLAKQFVTWFYQQLNALNPQFASNGVDSDWGPHHFFDDCKLKLNIQSQDDRVEQFDGSELVAERFRSLVQTEGLLFNPNVEEEGTRGVTEPHGLVVVISCGTIHREGTCMGMYEQRFGLVRDILNANNWKIKFTDINVKSELVNQMPSLSRIPNFPALTQGVS